MYQVNESVNVLVLGTSQDGGYPQAGCREECCFEAWNDHKLKRYKSSLAILLGNDCWLIDMTPDFSYQLRMIEARLNGKPNICGIFISHAHIGHYMGLIQLGLEVMNTKKIPVYVMGKMKSFLENNAPFTQLIELDNIKLRPMEKDETILLCDTLSITPFLVPHRNEFSETIGITVKSSEKSLLYVPDIDSWNSWDMDINDLIQRNNFALLDGTFYNDTELPGRNVQDVPHPYINDSLNKFSLLDEMDREKVYFTHLNHTNPVIKKYSLERSEVCDNSCHIAEDGMIFTL